MARSNSHSLRVSSTISRAFDNLPTLSSKAAARAAILEKLAADLRRHDHTDRHGDKRLMDVFAVLQDGSSAELDQHGVETMRRLDVQVSSRVAQEGC